MNQRLIKEGVGWRLGWHGEAELYRGLVGGKDWAFELTEAEWQDFCRLLGQLSQTMKQMANQLMDEERINCEAETDLLWMEVEGFPHAYSLRIILSGDRRCEGYWQPEAVQGLLQALPNLMFF